MAIFPKPESKEVISQAIRELPLLQGKSSLIEEAANEIYWAAILAPRKSNKEQDKELRRSVAGARGEIKSLIESIDQFLGCQSNLGSVAVRAIDRETTPDIYANDIGYVYVHNTRLFMGALRDKARDALSELPSGSKPKGRPHKNGQAENVTDTAGQWYEKLTGKKVTRIYDDYSGAHGSPFSGFLDEIFTALDIHASSDSLTHIIHDGQAV